MPKEAIIGVRELRARLSAYLRAVARGESVTIGDRSRRPVARLVPVRRSADDAVLEELTERGVVTPGVGKPSGTPRVASRRRTRSVADVVIADRG